MCTVEQIQALLTQGQGITPRPGMDYTPQGATPDYANPADPYGTVGKTPRNASDQEGGLAVDAAGKAGRFYK